MGDLLKRLPDQLAGWVADALAERVVDLEEPTLDVDERHPDCGRLEGPAKAALALQQRLLCLLLLAHVVDDRENAGRSLAVEKDGRGDLDRNPSPVVSDQDGLVRPCAGLAGEPPTERLDSGVLQLRRDELDGQRADQLAGRVARHPLAGRVDRGESPVDVERADHVLDMVEEELVRIHLVDPPRRTPLPGSRIFTAQPDAAARRPRGERFGNRRPTAGRSGLRLTGRHPTVSRPSERVLR